MKRVLILTASFGEGHNSAARAIAQALDATGEAETRIVDLYAQSIPLADKTIQKLYSLAINRFPGVWNSVFKLLDQPGLMEGMLWTGIPMRNAMDSVIREFHPHVIVATYPLYAYLFRQLQKSRLGLRLPFFTVITDSVGINSAWYRCRSDGYFLADAETSELLESKGVAPALLHPLGFPVEPAFGTSGFTAPTPPPWKLLFMPSTQLARAIEQIRAILALPDVELTVLAGKHTKVLDAITASGLADGTRCRLIGWTDTMPELLGTHHCFIGKAGGAIVQEAIASECPFVVSHLVPGQEEGNIALLERIDAGRPAHQSTEALIAVLNDMMTDDGAIWKQWKSNLAKHANPGAAGRIAKFLLRK